MRELNVRLIMCLALLFAATSGSGCASQTPAAGCSGQCASSPGQGPTNPTVNNDAELNGNYAFTFSGITGKWKRLFFFFHRGKIYGGRGR